MDGLGELGELVRRYRSDAGLSGAELARRAGVPQPSVSRVEAGRRLADVAIVERLVSSLDLSADTAGLLLERARHVYSMPLPARADAGVSVIPGQFLRYAAAARVVRSFASAMVPALLRTSDYYRAARGDNAAGDWQALIALLDDQSRSFEFVVTEGSLRTWPESVLLTGQLDRVRALAGRPNVRLGVVPWSVALPRMALCDFTIFDDRAAWAETFAAELTVTRADDIAACRAAFELIGGVAVYGDQAHGVIERLRADSVRIAR